MMIHQVDIAYNLENVRRRIVAAAQRASRDYHEVTLVAVSKTMPAETVLAAYQAGQRHFGENRVQESQEKITCLSSLSDVYWHLIGHLQTNKIKTALRLFDLIESVDSLHLAGALSRVAQAQGEKIAVLLEVNVAGEPSKFGFSPDELPGVAVSIASLPGLELQGLMTVAPISPNAEDVRPVFHRMRELRAGLCTTLPEVDWKHLSMGMTDDFEVGIEEGATIVRVGRAIFGVRG
jgi:hypothetical protein